MEVRDALMSWTVVASSLLESGGGVESKTMARRVGWWALLGLVGALGHGWVGLLACSDVGIGLGAGVFWVVGACTQAWVWGFLAGWLLLVDFGRYSFDLFSEGL